ncbi:MAG: siroheme synthase CysG, partial [Rhizobium sp.]|nr:siroheme synthase CysG [Rhizobium sp.]
MDVSEQRLSVFPAFFKVANAVAVVFGNGPEAFAKTRLLRNTQARVVAYVEAPDADYAAYLIEHNIDTVARSFTPSQVEGAVLVFAATGDAELDRSIVRAARARHIPANAVDQPDFCDFYTPALVNRAPIAVAVGTEGVGPVLAQMIRADIDRLLPRSLGRLAVLANSYRGAVDQLLPRGVARRLFWRSFFKGQVADAVASGDVGDARRRATRLLKDTVNEKVEGRIFLVGAGPGAEDLLTLRAHRLLMECDVIVHDALVPQAVIDMGRRDATRIPVGKRKGCHSKTQDEINDLLVELGREGKRVVRLKSGDPLVFGRAGEEMAALRAAGVAYEVVPGITSALAAAADFELPLTLRGVASSLVFTTGHDLHGETLP